MTVIDSIYCPYCKRISPMELVDSGFQPPGQERPFYERTRVCRVCERKYVTVEVLVDLVHEGDRDRAALEILIKTLVPQLKVDSQEHADV